MPSFNELFIKLKTCYREQLLLSTDTSKEEEFRKIGYIGFKKIFESAPL